MAVDGKGRIVCGYCNADLGPSGKPDETSIEDMCAACMTKELRGRFPAIKPAPAPVPPPVPIVDILRRLDDLEHRVDVMEKWADRKD